MLAEVQKLLAQGNISGAVESAAAFAAQAQPGDVELGLQACPRAARPSVALLLRDVLSRYPRSIMAAPVLMYAEPDSHPKHSLSFELPGPTAELRSPLPGLDFLGWLSPDVPMPAIVCNTLATGHHKTPWRRVVCRAAVFESAEEVFELDTLEVPGMWWAQLFGAVEGEIHVTARHMLAFPDAVEAARVAQMAARGLPQPPRGHFLTDADWGRQRSEGLLFRESCRHTFPHAHLL